MQQVTRAAHRQPAVLEVGLTWLQREKIAYIMRCRLLDERTHVARSRTRKSDTVPTNRLPHVTDSLEPVDIKK